MICVNLVLYNSAMKRRFFFVAFFLLIFGTVSAQKDSIDVFNISIEELLNLKVDIITKKSIPVRENPAVVSIITQEDIRYSNARDLKELLSLYVPGFQFGVDVEGAVGIGVRGLWAFEGKAKFGIFGDGKEVAQLAMAKVFKNGDWRSGYYRDQTFMLATGMITLEGKLGYLYNKS